MKPFAYGDRPFMEWMVTNVPEGKNGMLMTEKGTTIVSHLTAVATGEYAIMVFDQNGKYKSPVPDHFAVPCPAERGRYDLLMIVWYAAWVIDGIE